MDSIAIKHVFENKQFSKLLNEYFKEEGFDIDELFDWSPAAWDLEIMRIPMTEEGVNDMKALGVNAFNTTGQYDTEFSAIIVAPKFKNLLTWLLNFVELNDWETMDGFEPDVYEEYRDYLFDEEDE